MFRREPLSLPLADQVEDLGRVVTGEGPVAPRAPDRLVEAAVVHRVVAACLLALEEGRLFLPDRELRALHDAQAVITLATSLARRELPVAAPAIARATGAAPIVLKGAAIADRFYPDPALRGYGDVDLLVDRRSLDEAIRALLPLGYEERIEYRPGFGATHGHTIDMARAIGRRSVHVEVHWRVGDDVVGEPLSHASLSAWAEPIPGIHGAVYPAPPDQLLVCSLHLLSHREKRLAWIEDIRRLADALDPSSWELTFRRAHGLGLLWVLNRALDYAERYLGVRRQRPLPAGDPPPFGPLRAVEELDLQASVNIGRLLAMPWRKRPAFVRDVLVPTRDGLEGLVGGDEAGPLRLAARHAALIARGVALRR